MPQLSPLGQPSKGKSNVRIAVITIVALHAVFFGGLLLQGCKKNTADGAAGSTTAANTNTDLAPLTNAPYSDLSTNTSSAPTQQAAAPLTFPNSSNLAAAAPGDTALAPAATPLAAPVASASSSEYTVVRGDYPAKIAKDHGVSVTALMKANPGLDPRKLREHQKIIIPAAAPSPAGSASAAATAAPAGVATPAAGGTIHEVKPGDTLTRIAHQHNVSVKAIRSANNLKTDRIHAGQKLKIPSGKAAEAGDGTGSPAARSAAVKPAAAGSLQ